MQTLFHSAKRFWSYLDCCKGCVRDWFVVRAHTTHAKVWLMAISFSESSFFPIPAEVLLLPILFSGATRWIYYATLTTLFSVFGGAFGYFIGAFFFEIFGDFIITTYHLEAQMQYVAELYNDNAFWAIFTAAFTPIPYKVFTLSAGFFSVNFIVFMVASLIGRGSRFFIVSYIAKRYGERLGDIMFKYFNVVSLIILVAVLFFILL